MLGFLLFYFTKVLLVTKTQPDILILFMVCPVGVNYSGARRFVFVFWVLTVFMRLEANGKERVVSYELRRAQK
jgi:hypothetical protein